MPPSRASSKTPQIFKLAGVTYGAVLLTTLLAVGAYYYFAPSNAVELKNDSVAVGSVWVAIYPGGATRDLSQMKEGEVTLSTFRFETRDSATQVLAYYRRRFRPPMYQSSTVTPGADGGTIQAVAHKGKTTTLLRVHSTAAGAECEITTVDQPGSHP